MVTKRNRREARQYAFQMLYTIGICFIHSFLNMTFRKLNIIFITMKFISI